MSNNIIYIHVCVLTIWENVLANLLNSIVSSKLIDNVNEVRIGILGDSILVDNFIKEKYPTVWVKLKIIFKSNNLKLYERPTLQHLRVSSEKEEDFNVLYLHTKGISYKNLNLSNNIKAWVNMMLYFLVEKYENCLKLLDKHSSIGCKLEKYNNSNKNQHYSGNFWWATSDHIKSLPKIIPPGYLSPEFWIGSGKNNLHSVHQCSASNLYAICYTPNYYNGSNNKIITNRTNYINSRNRMSQIHCGQKIVKKAINAVIPTIKRKIVNPKPKQVNKQTLGVPTPRRNVSAKSRQLATNTRRTRLIKFK